MSKFDEIMREFHAHLDGCTQCKEHQFDLCSEGRRIMDLNFNAKKILNHRYGKTAEPYTGCRCDECRPDLQY